MFFLGILFSQYILAANSNCSTGQHWVRAYYRHAYYRSDGTFIKATNVTAHCQGNPPGYDKWKALLKNNRPSQWPYANEHSKEWTDEETERMIESLNDIPTDLWSNLIKGFYRMDKSYIGNVNAAASDTNENIVLYDSAFSNHDLTEVLVHELAHTNYRKLDPPIQDDYNNSNYWFVVKDKNNDPKIILGRSNFVSSDGENGPDEDYANNIQYYLFHNKELQQKTPTAYEWIKNHFGDKFKIRGRK